MYKKQHTLKIFSKLTLLSSVIIFLQFGCNLVKSSSENSSNIDTASASSSKSASDNNDKGNGAPEICKNAYYPVSPTVERKYHINYVSNPSLSQDYTEKYTDFNGDNFVAKTDFKDVSTTINWRCLPEGLLATQYGNSIDIKSGGGAKIDTLNSKGVTFPVESGWNTGEKWTGGYDVKETIKTVGGAESVAGNGTVNQDGEVIGTEQTTVPAGTFQTVKVKVKTLLDLTVKVGGMTVPTKTNMDTTAWFAKDVGMVKSETGMGGKNMATTELLSYKK